MTHVRFATISCALLCLGCGGGSGDNGGRSSNAGPGNAATSGDARWSPFASTNLGDGILGCQAHAGDGRTNSTIDPFPDSELVGVTATDYDRGRSWTLGDSMGGWVPAGTYVGDLAFSCTYRAPYTSYGSAIDHFSGEVFGGRPQGEFFGSPLQRTPLYDWPEFELQGGETVESISAGWNLVVSDDQLIDSSASIPWMLRSTRYGVLVTRCEDGRYPPQFEDTGEPIGNNVVCITIKDGGVRGLYDFVSEHGTVKPSASSFGYENDPGLTKDVEHDANCLELQIEDSDDPNISDKYEEDCGV